MRKYSPLLLLIFISAIGPLDKKPVTENLALSDQEVFVFDGSHQVKGDQTLRVSTRTGGRDGSQFVLNHWHSEGADSATIEDVKAARGKHQSELCLYNISGSVKRTGDTLTAKLTTGADSIYLYSMAEKKCIRLPAWVNIIMVSHDAYGRMCVPRIDHTQLSTEIYCLPALSDRKALYKVRAAKRDQANFTYIIATNGEDVIELNGDDDYIIIGSDYFEMK